MAHVIHSINVTASGLCHHMDNAVDDSHHQYATCLTEAADAMVLGRNTFDLFMAFWPGAVHRHDLPASTLELAKAFNTVAKLVVSDRPLALTWNNTQQVSGSGLEGIRRVLDELEGTAVVFGSPGLAASLLGEGLIDELHIVAQPLVGAEGPRAFNNQEERVNLSLLGVDAFPSGAVLLRYRVAARQSR